MNDKPNLPNVQANLLEAARKTRTPVNVIFMNGFQMKGTVAGHDNYCILLMAAGKQNMIYKHAISTVVPMNMLNLRDEAEASGAAIEAQ